ncbi:MOSC N-terminal beta barrel domain-containing protein [Roridomyces roridus]|uniref:MOSC N-terminal beta barrel domain-containing protein n=1 Tax=Roridomyces roridus TaxID=1738132 RepID=A0AAD7B5M8_9AGAR|nr:MOSC N-terminal beta barrel domain-containing protein [Roridomyces roridus]
MPGYTLSSGLLCLLLVICSAVFLLRPKQATHSRRSSTMSNVFVSKILVHPLKSCRGISVNKARYTPEGLEYDRQWCIIEAKDHTVITAREFPKMVLITPSIVEDSGALLISFPEDSGCEPFSVPLRPDLTTLSGWKRLDQVKFYTVSPWEAYICEALGPSRSPSEILSSYFGRPVHLVFKGERERLCEPTPTYNKKAPAVFQDCYPLMVLSEESVTRIEEELRNHVGKQGVDEHWRTDRVVIERFRPNIVFRGAGPFAEDKWRQITIGNSPTINLVSHCTRCLLPNVCTESGERDKAVPYKIIMKFRTGLDVNKMKACVGRNGVPTDIGEISVGDHVAAEL